MPTDRTPLIPKHSSTNFWEFGQSFQPEIDYHAQFCSLVGIPSSDTPLKKQPAIEPKSLYGRIRRQLNSQNRTYLFTASISNTLLLTQVIIGAAVTALGASESSHILITLFGAMNTIIAGVVAYLKSRGQPMRARMYRDDLERVADDIENTEVMWLGISRGIHGYQDIDVDKAVTVRSEVARLTRLYERAVRSNTMNNPDMYLASGGAGGETALRSRPQGPGGSVPVQVPNTAAAGPSAGGPVAPILDPDEAPATAVTKQISKEAGVPADGSNTTTTTTSDSSKTDSTTPSAPTDTADKDKDQSKPLLDAPNPPDDTIPGSVPMPAPLKV